MKKIYAIILSILSVFLFFSCNNSVKMKTVDDFEDLVSVSFNLDNSRAITSLATPQEYTYSMTGIYSDETQISLQGLSYDEFLSTTIHVKTGVWNFTLTAYDGDIAVYYDTKEITIEYGGLTVGFMLKAVQGGTASIRIEVIFPYAEVYKISAILYEDISTDSEGIELSSFVRGHYDAENDFIILTNDTIPTGVNRIIKIYFYNYYDDCLGSYTESIYLAPGQTLNLVRRLENLNGYTQLFIYSGGRKNSSWGKADVINYTHKLDFPFKAVNGNLTYDFKPIAETNRYIANLPCGEYNLFFGDNDTGKTFNVTSSGRGSVSYDFDYDLVLYFHEGLDNLFLGGNATSGVSILMTGPITEDNILRLGSWIKQGKRLVGLDLSFTTGLTNFPDESFSEAKIVTITIPDGVITIGKNAFETCRYLKSINIPNTVTYIDDYAFNNCGSLESIVIPDSVTKIGNFTFRGCSSLKSITFNDTSSWYQTTNLSDWENCENGTEVDLSNPENNIQYFKKNYFWYKK